MGVKQKDRERSDEQVLVQRRALIAEQVLERLGRPFNLFGVCVSQVTEHFFRVNVVVGDGVERRIGHSYFVEETVDGIVSDPVIVRAYRNN